MANDLIPYKRPGEDFTGQATAAVTGKRVLRVSGNVTSGPGLSSTAEGSNPRVALHDGVDATQPIGIAKYDAPINGKVGVARAGIVPVTAGGAVTAGMALKSDATGKVVAVGTGSKVGVALSDAALDQDCMVALMLA